MLWAYECIGNYGIIFTVFFQEAVGVKSKVQVKADFASKAGKGHHGTVAQDSSSRASDRTKLVASIDLRRPNFFPPLEETSPVGKPVKLKRWEAIELIKSVSA